MSRYEKRLICILVLFFIVLVCGEKQLLKQENFFVKPCSCKGNKLLENTFGNYDYFPNEYYENAKHHKIVKKQMDYDLNDVTGSKLKKSVMYHPGKKLKKSTKESKISSKSKGEKIKFNSLENESPYPQKEEQTEKHSSRMICKIPDRSDCHYYFECEIQPDGSMKMARKRCPEDETFSIRYKECIRLSPHKGYIREKKQISYFSKSKCPEPPPEGDSEPANEWLDAPQGSSQKIPSEFQPKPKLRLRIYHLRCKKETKQSHQNKKIRQKRNTLIKINDQDSIKLFKEKKVKRHLHHHHHHHVHRHHPRSYVIRVNKKAKNKEENFNDDDEADDEDDEDDDEDEEYENEDGDESGTKNENEEKPVQKEGLKDLFKSAKEAVVSKIKNIDSNPQSQSQYQADVKQYLGKIHYTQSNRKSESTPGSEYDLPNKVLIDANIKVDEEVSQALKNILGKGLRQNFKPIS